MGFYVNIIWLPILIPLIVGGYTFLQHEDLAMAFNEMVRKRTIIITIAALFLCVIIQTTIL